MRQTTFHPDAEVFTPDRTFSWEEFAGQYCSFNFITPRGLLTFDGQRWEGFQWWWSAQTQKVLKHCAALLFYPLSLPSPTLVITGGLQSDLCASRMCVSAWASYDFGFRSSSVDTSSQMQEARFLHSIVQTGQEVLVTGGQRRDAGHHQFLRCCEVARGVGSGSQVRWENAPQLNRRRSTHSSLYFRKNVYVFGGFCGSGRLSHDIEVLPPSKSSWRLIVLKTIILAGVAAVPMSNSIWLIGGSDGYCTSSVVVVFDTEKETAEVMKTGMAEARAKVVAALVNGTVMIVGDMVETLSPCSTDFPPLEKHESICAFTSNSLFSIT